MRKIALLTTLLFFSAQGQATQHIDLGIGFNFPMGIEKVSDNSDTGLAGNIAWRNDANKYLSLGFGYYYLGTNNSTLNNRAIYALSKYIFIDQDKVLVPFLNAGLGVSDTRSHSSTQNLFTGFLGGGFENELDDNFSLNFTLNYHLISPNNTKPSEQHLAVALIGLSYRYGTDVVSNANEEIVQFYDRDGDGIDDSSDQCPNTPLGTDVNYLGCEKEKEIKKVFDIKFELGTAKLQAQYNIELIKIAKLLKKHTSLTIEVHGHTDNTGPRDLNQSLSQQRAESVAEYLIIEKGISADRVFARGYGQDRPIASNESQLGQMKNRRVEIKFITN